MLPEGDYISKAREDKITLVRLSKAGFVGKRKPWMLDLKPYELNALQLLSVEQPYELVKLLRTDFDMLGHCINHPEYTKFQIPKKKGGHRDICDPGRNLKHLQQSLNFYLQGYYLCVRPENVHGFVINPYSNWPYCNIASNAALHVGRKYVLNVDLKDFFPGISAKTVHQLFLSDRFRFTPQIATALALLSTYEGRLPAGAPSSPVISNFVCKDLDEALMSFSREHWLTYSRYADDLTFSSDARITDDTLLDIICLIQERGFRVNQQKIYLKTSSRRQSVTGLTVNEKVNIDRHLLKKIRAMLHDFLVNGPEMAAHRHYHIGGQEPDRLALKFAYRMRGYVNFVGQIRGKNDPIYLRMREDLLMAWERVEGALEMYSPR